MRLRDLFPGDMARVAGLRRRSFLGHDRPVCRGPIAGARLPARLPGSDRDEYRAVCGAGQPECSGQHLGYGRPEMRGPFAGGQVSIVNRMVFWTESKLIWFVRELCFQNPAHSTGAGPERVRHHMGVLRPDKVHRGRTLYEYGH